MNEDLGEPVDEQYEKAVKKLAKLKLNDDPKAAEWEEYCKELELDIPNHHKYVFVGRVGQFTPIKDGYGGGVLYRNDGERISAATGSKGYRWLESSFVKEHGMMDAIDMSYYQKKVDKAKEAIEKLVDVDYFISDQVPERSVIHGFMNIPDNWPDEVPFDEDHIL